MPQIVTCPDCGRKLKVPDDLIGKRVKCPGCGQKFVGEVEDGGADDAEEAPPRTSVATSRTDEAPRTRRRGDEIDDRPKSRRRVDEEEDEDYPIKKRRRDEEGGSLAPTKGEIRTGWERVRFGVNLVIIACWIGVAAVVAMVLGYLVLALFVGASMGSMIGGGPSGGPLTRQDVDSMAGQAAGTMTAALVGGCLLWGLLGLLSLAYLAACTTGRGFCMGVAPTRKTEGLKGLAIAAFSLSVAYLLIPMFIFGGAALMYRAGGGCVVIPGYGIWGMVALADLICFMLFLRGAAVAMKKEGLAQNILFSMIAIIIYCLTLPAIPFVLAFAFFGSMLSAFSTINPHNPGVAAGNVAGTSAAFVVGGLACVGLEVIIGLVLFIWYVALLYQLRSAVDGWLDRN